MTKSPSFSLPGSFSARMIMLVAVLVILIYLLLPSPKVEDLPGAVKSDEPGDTVQIAGVSAYFTNMDQQKVLSFYQDQFSRSSFLGLPLPTIVFSRPVQEAHQFISDQLITTYLYELIHPFRESIYLNGWVEGKLPPVYRRWINHAINPKGVHFDAKVTIRQIESPLWARMLVFTLTIGAIFVLIGHTKRITSSP